MNTENKDVRVMWNFGKNSAIVLMKYLYDFLYYQDLFIITINGKELKSSVKLEDTKTHILIFIFQYDIAEMEKEYNERTK